MINKQNIKIVHVEASSRCNSHCPMCSRYTGLGRIQPNLKEQDLSPDVFYKLFTKEFTGQLEHVYFSGVYGDPCLNKLLPEFVSYLIDNGCKSVSIDTNGGYRNSEWWADLARPGVQINFALDGASNETLGQYRIGVSYDKVLANLKSYVSAGGSAQWNFIVFKHNEHEVELARNLADELAVDFRIKVTQKFKNRKNFRVLKNGKEIGLLEPPVNEKYRHPNIGSQGHMPSSVFKFDLEKFNIFKNNGIACKSLERQEVFLAAEGLLFPCCYLGTYTHDSPGSYQFNQLYDVNDFDLKCHSVDAILEKFYDISNKWNSEPADGNLLTCMWTCGVNENTTLYYTDKLNKKNILGE